MQESFAVQTQTSRCGEVLVVDDNPDNLRVVSEILYKDGAEVSYALSAAAALEHIEQRKPDVILLDVSMPEMDGFELCLRLKNNPDTRHIPVIFLTAHRDEEHILRGFEVGAVDYVTKPFRVTEMLSRVRTHLALKRAQDNLNARNNELAEANRRKDAFFSILAHDLRNPLSGMMALSRLLYEEHDQLSGAELQEMSATLSATSTQLHKLLESLLEWAQLQLSSSEAIPERVVPEQIISDISELFSGTAAQKQIKIVSSFETDKAVHADRNMFTSILRNLLSNALKYSRTGTTVRIEVRTVGNQVEFRVQDEGIGMEPELVHKLFSQGKLNSTPGTDGEEGSGLGLMLCKEQVELNGGTMDVESVLGEGSVFRFTLPAAM